MNFEYLEENQEILSKNKCITFLLVPSFLLCLVIFAALLGFALAFHIIFLPSIVYTRPLLVNITTTTSCGNSTLKTYGECQQISSNLWIKNTCDKDFYYTQNCTDINCVRCSPIQKNSMTCPINSPFYYKCETEFSWIGRIEHYYDSGCITKTGKYTIYSQDQMCHLVGNTPSKVYCRIVNYIPKLYRRYYKDNNCQESWFDVEIFSNICVPLGDGYYGRVSDCDGNFKNYFYVNQ